MNNQGLISIVIPCFNQAHFLKEAIESVINQTYKTYEIIVVNDGSTDKTSHIANNFDAVILLEQSNQGLAASRNNGLKLCKGEFVIFLDADDILLTDSLQIGINSFKENPECVFVSGLCQRVDENNSQLETVQPTLFSNDYYESLLRSNFIWSPANVMYRRKLFEEIEPFDTSLNPVADYELYLRITRKFPIFHHSNVITNYRQHQSSMSKNYKIMLDDVLKVYEQQKDFISSNKSYKKAAKLGVSDYKEMYLGGIYYQFSQSFKKGEFSNAAKNLKDLLEFPTKLPKLFFNLILIKLKLKNP